MVGVRDPGFRGGLLVDDVGWLFLFLLSFLLEEEEEDEEEEEEEDAGWTDDDGTKEMERVPENRMIDTARATGRTAVIGLG